LLSLCFNANHVNSTTSQVGGKFRGTVTLAASAVDGDEAALRELVLDTPLGRRWVPDRSAVANVILPESRQMIGFVLKRKK